MLNRTLLIVDDDRSVLKMLSSFFAKAGYSVVQHHDGKRALELLEHEQFDIVITDLMLDGVSGFDILKKTRQFSPHTEVVVITGHSSIDTAVRAMREGAFDYITKPIALEEISIVIEKAYERRSFLTEIKHLRDQVRQFAHFDNIIATSAAMQQVMGMVRRIARSSSTVMIEGESGTGKEVIARAIHAHGLRAEGPFVAINCAALPETLLESELFGHVKGSFTGANTNKKGLFEEAIGGTIFLDEIAETTPAFQVKLLRVLQENEIRRVGDTHDIPVDARVLASSNRPITRMVEEGSFRQDLFFRLRVLPLYLPPLRERVADIVPLAKFFIDRYCSKASRKRVKIHRTTIKKLETYQWPGNVRELENAIERAMILLEHDEIMPEDLLLDQAEAHNSTRDFSCMSLKEAEKLHISAMLEATGWNQKEASRRLGIGYNTLWRKLNEYGISRAKTAKNPS
jgi:two-component system, NtrC family, response regulator AtoC